MIKATKAQIQIAKLYKIPLRQAHTVNMKKVKAYLKYLETPAGAVEKWLDEHTITKGVS